MFLKKDELHEWTRAAIESSKFPEELRQSPERQRVRVITTTVCRKGYRPWQLRLCTTLMDPQQYPAGELIALYMRRWRLEVHLRSLKEHLGLARLTAKTPTIIRKEILAGLLAYNAVQLCAAMSRGPTGRISFERVRELLAEFSARMSTATTRRLPELHRQMLDLIAHAVVPRQERPPEPRAVIKHPNCYPFLRISRSTWRQRILCA
jgi:hypothetical protein